VKRQASVLLFAMVYPTLLAWCYFVALVGSSSARNPLVIAFYVMGKGIQFVFPLAWLWWTDRQSLRLSRPSFEGLALGLAFGLAVGVAGLGFYYGWLRDSGLLRETPARIHARLVQFGVATPVGFVLFGTFLSVAHSLLEEYYWRWFVFGRLRRHLPLWPAVVVASLAFMAHHVVVLAVFFTGRFWTMALPLSLCVAVGGGVWAWLYNRTGSIYSPWLSHALIDGAIMTAGFDLLVR
jgi:membrane protease YdiL (CAAX protease family)